MNLKILVEFETKLKAHQYERLREIRDYQSVMNICKTIHTRMRLYYGKEDSVLLITKHIRKTPNGAWDIAYPINEIIVTEEEIKKYTIKKIKIEEN